MYEPLMKIDIEGMAANADQAEKFVKQFANKNRLMILCVLSEGELSVGELNQKIPLSQSALSQHLAKLRDAGLVETRRDSQTIFYRLDDPNVKTIIASLYEIFCH
jgi:DNA-binding transcriptional ArsR family regulator